MYVNFERVVACEVQNILTKCAVGMNTPLAKVEILLLGHLSITLVHNLRSSKLPKYMHNYLPY
jgi:hypothetical protein